MKKRTINQDMPIGKLTRIKDFLPSPEDAYWARIAQAREKTLLKKSALSHKQVWH